MYDTLLVREAADATFAITEATAFMADRTLILAATCIFLVKAAIYAYQLSVFDR